MGSTRRVSKNLLVSKNLSVASKGSVRRGKGNAPRGSGGTVNLTLNAEHAHGLLLALTQALHGSLGSTRKKGGGGPKSGGPAGSGSTGRSRGRGRSGGGAGSGRGPKSPDGLA